MSLASYLHNFLSNIATELGWSVSGSSYDFSVSEALLDYGVDTEAEATDLNKLYALGKVKVLEAVKRAISFDYDYSANSASFKRSQIFEQVNQLYENALMDALFYLPTYQIEIGTIDQTKTDPYAYYPYEDR